MEGNGDRTGKFEVFQLRGNVDFITFLSSFPNFMKKTAIFFSKKKNWISKAAHGYVRGGLNYKPGGF